MCSSSRHFPLSDNYICISSFPFSLLPSLQCSGGTVTHASDRRLISWALGSWCSRGCWMLLSHPLQVEQYESSVFSHTNTLSTQCRCMRIALGVCGRGMLRRRTLHLTVVVNLQFSLSHLSFVHFIAAAAAWDQNRWQILPPPYQSASVYITWLHQHWVWNMPDGNGSLWWQTNHRIIVFPSITTSSAVVVQ